jgi:ribosomal protein S18 acetylase RimI-like enzyme
MVEIDGQWIIREFTPQDYDQVRTVWQRTDLARPERADTLDIIMQTLKLGGTLLVLIDKSNNKIVGTSWITNDGRRLHLQYFGILPEYQGRGLAHLLLKHSLEFAQNKGLQIKLEVHKDNFKAIDLYKKWGFKPLGDYHVYILRNINELNIEQKANQIFSQRNKPKN